MLREYQGIVKFFRIIQNNYYSLDELTPKIITPNAIWTRKMPFTRCIRNNLTNVIVL